MFAIFSMHTGLLYLCVQKWRQLKNDKKYSQVVKTTSGLILLLLLLGMTVPISSFGVDMNMSVSSKKLKWLHFGQARHRSRV